MHMTALCFKIPRYSEKEVLGKPGAHFVNPESIEEAQKLFYDLLKKPGKSVTIVQQLRHKKGHYFWIESILTNFLHKPDINGIVSNFRDITDRKLAEEKEKEI